MKNLSDLLKRFANLKDPKEERQRIASVIHTVCGIEIPEGKIVLKNGVVRLPISPIEKNEIHMKKEELLQEFLKREMNIFSVL